MAEGASEVRISTRRRFAVSWLDVQTSSASSSGESSSPNAARMPACAFEEFYVWEGPLGGAAHPRARAGRGDGGCEAGGPAADHEPVDAATPGHGPRVFAKDS